MFEKSLQPVLITKDIDKTVSAYEALGYKLTHRPIKEEGRRSFLLRNASGSEIDVWEASDMGMFGNASVSFFGFRMNVDDLEEALKTVKEAGFTVVAGPVNVSNGLGLIIKDNNGINILLLQHIKHNEENVTDADKEEMNQLVNKAKEALK